MLLISFNSNAQKTILIKCGKIFNSKTGQVVEKQNIVIRGNIIIDVTKDNVSNSILLFVIFNKFDTKA